MPFSPEDIKIYYADIPRRTPASANRATGEIFLNINRWHKIKPSHKVFIILHEMAHIVLNTSNEYAVDQWAQEQYIAMGYPLTESVKALTQVLPGRSAEQIKRAELQMQRATQINNKNMQLVSNNEPFFEMFNTKQDEFLGMGKKGKEKRGTNRDLRVEKKRARNENLKLKGQSKYILAQQGISEKQLGKKNTRNMIAGIGSAAVGITSQALGGGPAGAELGNTFGKALGVTDEDDAPQSNATVGSDGATPRSMTSKQKTTNDADADAVKWYKNPKYIIAIVVVVLAIAGGIFYYKKKHK
jgi:hypothetical protein